MAILGWETFVLLNFRPFCRRLTDALTSSFRNVLSAAIRKLTVRNFENIFGSRTIFAIVQLVK